MRISRANAHTKGEEQAAVWLLPFLLLEALVVTTMSSYEDPSNRILVIGAGIVGSCLASLLSSTTSHSILLVDRKVQALPGSTGLAPGFVGQYNDIPVLTELARRSVRRYATIEGAFANLGGLELAETEVGEANLQRRCEAANQVGLTAELLSKADAVKLAPELINPDKVRAGLFFPLDGTADPKRIAASQQDTARDNGAQLVDASVTNIEKRADNHFVAYSNIGEIHTEKVVVCTGIWASQLLGQGVPVIPVEHPYSYSIARQRRSKTSPFLRWPESHVYARDHGERDGIGSYDHMPLPVSSDQLTPEARGPWQDCFQGVLSQARSKLATDVKSMFKPEDAFNGRFSVTPDGKPLVGCLPNGIYCAVAVWVTQAAGTAELVRDLLLNQVDEQDRWMLQQLDPSRFAGGNPDLQRSQAASMYNDIYNRTTV